MSAQDLARRLGAVIAAVGLMGAGAPSPEDAFGMMQVAMSVAASAQEKLPTFADAHSYRVTMIEPGHPTMVAIFDEDANALKLTSAQRSAGTMYFVGGTMYAQFGDGAWTKFDARSISKATAARLASSAPSAAPAAKRVDDRIQPLPDRVLHGVRMGSFRMNKPARYVDRHFAADKTVTVTCFYEKVTRQLRLCSVPQLLTMAFDRYDDPTNRFTIPAAALHAPRMVF